MKKKLIVSVLLAILLIASLCFVGCGKNNDNDSSSKEPERTQLSASDVYKKVNPSVVFILTQQSNAYASGSGFFIDNSGTVVTNYHVIEDALVGAIQLYDGTTAKITKVIGYDEDLDIAILKTDATGTPAKLTTEQSEIGETVYAIGYPQAFKLGVTSSTFTTGMISMYRSLSGYTYIQSTVDITHGNSGGALINTYGEIIGITTAGLSYGDIDYMNLSIPVQRIDTVGRNVNETLEVVTKRHYPVYVNYYTDGSKYKTQTLQYENKATAPTAPTKTGYTFSGWYTDTKLNTRYDFGKSVVENINLYAKFEINTYSIKYTLNSGSFSSGNIKNSYTVNDCGTALPIPKRSGYLFEGWKYNGNFIDNLPDRNNIANLTLYASWIEGTEGLTIKNGVVSSCNTSATNITIPASYRGEEITTIGSNAFKNCTNLKSVTFGSNITNIQNGAFYGCTELTSITIPNSVTTIGESSFMSCSALENITLPFIGASKTSSYGYNAVLGYIFGYTTSESNSDIPRTTYQFKDYKTKEYYHYYIPEKLKKVIITNTTTINESAFYGCTGLTSVTIPDNVTSINSHAFTNCSGLTSITIPNSVTSIGRGAFSGCSKLTNIAIPNSIKSIDDDAFSHCIGLTSVKWNAENCTSVGTYYGELFNGCKNLTTVTIGDKVKTIPNSAFSHCIGLTSITIPNSVTSIGKYAFSNCIELTSITIPNSVKSIGDCVFNDCTKLKTIYYKGTEEQWNNLKKSVILGIRGYTIVYNA